MDNELLKTAASGWLAKIASLTEQIGMPLDECASERDNLIKQVLITLYLFAALLLYLS
jgi:hypothetical protein